MVKITVTVMSHGHRDDDLAAAWTHGIPERPGLTESHISKNVVVISCVGIIMRAPPFIYATSSRERLAEGDRPRSALARRRRAYSAPWRRTDQPWLALARALF